MDVSRDAHAASVCTPAGASLAVSRWVFLLGSRGRCGTGWCSANGSALEQLPLVALACWRFRWLRKSRAGSEPAL